MCRQSVFLNWMHMKNALTFTLFHSVHFNHFWIVHFIETLFSKKYSGSWMMIYTRTHLKIQMHRFLTIQWIEYVSIEGMCTNFFFIITVKMMPDVMCKISLQQCSFLCVKPFNDIGNEIMCNTRPVKVSSFGCFGAVVNSNSYVFAPRSIKIFYFYQW